MSEPLELLVVEGPIKGARFTPTEAGLKLGRSSSCDMAITDPALSRNHCLFELRDGSLWVTDLASANGTEVNGESVTEKELKLGDRVSAGDSVVEVVEVGAGPSQAAVQPQAEVSAVDLGFGREGQSGAETAAHGGNMLRTALWGICGVVVLGAAAYILLAPEGRGGGSSDPSPLMRGPERPKLMSLSYEKVQASSEGIFRYAMQVGGVKDEHGVKKVLTVTVDDVLSDNRHVEKDAELAPDKLDKLATMVSASGVTKLEREYTGIAAKSNELKSSRLKVVTADEIFEVSVENTTPPDEFKSIAAQLEAFSKNELGIWAIQYSSDKLVEMAEASMKSGDAKWDERDVQYGNIAAAIRHYREAVVDLETVNPKPDFHEALVEKLSRAKDELDSRYRDQNFQCDRAIRLEDWPQAQMELKVLCEMVPDEQDPRHGDAAAKLMDVESRMKKK